MGCHSMWTIDRIAYDNLEPLTFSLRQPARRRKSASALPCCSAICVIQAILPRLSPRLDFISNGRVTLGLGFGSRENDYKAVEIPFEHRGSRAVEQVQLMKRLWTEDNVTHKGKFYNVENLTVGPRPIQKPHPPIWTGGSAETALKRAGTWANGFICGSSAIAGFPGDLGKNQRATPRSRTKSERNYQSQSRRSWPSTTTRPKPSRRSKTYVDALLRPPARRRRRHCLLVGSAAAIADQDRIRSFSQGLDTLIIGVADPDPRQLDLFGEKVLPQVKR